MCVGAFGLCIQGCGTLISFSCAAGKPSSTFGRAAGVALGSLLVHCALLPLQLAALFLFSTGVGCVRRCGDLALVLARLPFPGLTGAACGCQRPRVRLLPAPAAGWPAVSPPAGHYKAGAPPPFDGAERAEAAFLNWCNMERCGYEKGFNDWKICCPCSERGRRVLAGITLCWIYALVYIFQQGLLMLLAIPLAASLAAFIIGWVYLPLGAAATLLSAPLLWQGHLYTVLPSAVERAGQASGGLCVDACAHTATWIFILPASLRCCRRCRRFRCCSCAGGGGGGGGGGAPPSGERDEPARGDLVKFRPSPWARMWLRVLADGPEKPLPPPAAPQLQTGAVLSSSGLGGGGVGAPSWPSARLGGGGGGLRPASGRFLVSFLEGPLGVAVAAPPPPPFSSGGAGGFQYYTSGGGGAGAAAHALLTVAPAFAKVASWRGPSPGGHSVRRLVAVEVGSGHMVTTFTAPSPLAAPPLPLPPPPALCFLCGQASSPYLSLRPICTRGHNTCLPCAAVVLRSAAANEHLGRARFWGALAACPLSPSGAPPGAACALRLREEEEEHGTVAAGLLSPGEWARLATLRALQEAALRREAPLGAPHDLAPCASQGCAGVAAPGVLCLCCGAASAATSVRASDGVVVEVPLAPPPPKAPPQLPEWPSFWETLGELPVTLPPLVVEFASGGGGVR
jgi:hypothetical protein